MGIINNCCPEETSGGGIVVLGDILDPSCRSLCNILTLSGVDFIFKGVSIHEKNPAAREAFLKKHSELELPVLYHSNQRINSDVFSQVMYLSRVEPYIKEIMLPEKTFDTQNYGQWVKNVLAPAVA